MEYVGSHNQCIRKSSRNRFLSAIYFLKIGKEYDNYNNLSKCLEGFVLRWFF